MGLNSSAVRARLHSPLCASWKKEFYPGIPEFRKSSFTPWRAFTINVTISAIAWHSGFHRESLFLPSITQPYLKFQHKLHFPQQCHWLGGDV